MGEESVENSNFEIHTVKLPRTIHRTPFPEKKFLDPCNNMERLKKFNKKNYCFYHRFYIFGIKKLKADRIKKMLTIFKFHWSYYLKDNSRFNKF